MFKQWPSSVISIPVIGDRCASRDSEEEENRSRDNGQHGGGKEDAPMEVVDGETHQGDGN